MAKLFIRKRANPPTHASPMPSSPTSLPIPQLRNLMDVTTSMAPRMAQARDLRPAVCLSFGHRMISASNRCTDPSSTLTSMEKGGLPAAPFIAMAAITFSQTSTTGSPPSSPIRHLVHSEHPMAAVSQRRPAGNKWISRLAIPSMPSFTNTRMAPFGWRGRSGLSAASPMTLHS